MAIRYEEISLTHPRETAEKLCKQLREMGFHGVAIELIGPSGRAGYHHSSKRWQAAGALVGCMTVATASLVGVIRQEAEAGRADDVPVVTAEELFGNEANAERSQ